MFSEVLYVNARPFGHSPLFHLDMTASGRALCTPTPLSSKWYGIKNKFASLCH
jgi:hypothetical protein